MVGQGRTTYKYQEMGMNVNASTIDHRTKWRSKLQLYVIVWPATLNKIHIALSNIKFSKTTNDEDSSDEPNRPLLQNTSPFIRIRFSKQFKRENRAWSIFKLMIYSINDHHCVGKGTYSMLLYLTFFYGRQYLPLKSANWDQNQLETTYLNK